MSFQPLRGVLTHFFTLLVRESGSTHGAWSAEDAAKLELTFASLPAGERAALESDAEQAAKQAVEQVLREVQTCASAAGQSWPAESEPDSTAASAASPLRTKAPP